MSALESAETSRDGQLVPEEEVERGGPEVMTFEATEAVTVKSGRGRSAPSEPGQTFQPQAAATETLRPPHWENLPEAPAESAGPSETAAQPPPDGPSEAQPEAPTPEAEPEPKPAPEGPEAEPVKES